MGLLARWVGADDPGRPRSERGTLMGPHRTPPWQMRDAIKPVGTTRVGGTLPAASAAAAAEICGVVAAEKIWSFRALFSLFCTFRAFLDVLLWLFCMFWNVFGRFTAFS